MGGHIAVERSVLLSVELANTLVLQSPKLVVVVASQPLGDLLRQVAWGRVDRRWKVVVHNAGPCGTKEVINVKKGDVVELVAHLARGVRSASVVEEVLGEAVAVTPPQRKRVTNVAVPEDGDEELHGGRTCLMTRCLR